MQYQSGQDVWEVAGRGATPSNVGLRQPPNTWPKHTFKMKGQDHPSLKGSVLFQLERLTSSLGKYWCLYEKHNNHF